MERHNLGDEMFRLVNVYLAENGLKVNRGAIVDATIIDAPTSQRTKTRPVIPICTRHAKAINGTSA